MKTSNPNIVERTTRSVIEHKLLVALEDGSGKVAILATKQDLMDMISALTGEIPTPDGWKRHKELADGMIQLLREAFKS